MTNLPVNAIKQRFNKVITERNRVILSAPTGSGKSTMIPQFLLDDCGVAGKILVLQPRRLAARMLAGYVASERQSELGSEIGYQTRLESKKSRSTRVLYITAGILPRLLISDRKLSNIGAIIFDEFHERSLNTDIGLGLVRHLQETTRPDLKLIVMSATLDVTELESFLGNVDSITCDTRRFPVETSYLPAIQKREIWDSAASALTSLLKSEADGDVLIFMPGVFEIHRTIDACKKIKSGEKLAITALHSNLPSDQQNAIMRRCEYRKIIVSTNVAETSLTVPGVRHVIDSGLARISRYAPGRGINTLLLEPISKASAEQRAGRAGRECPGRCIRLWSEKEHHRRTARTDAEVQRIDLSESILHLISLGFRDIGRFPWISQPPEEAITQGIRLLRALGAMDEKKPTLTDLGKNLALLPCHPRISRMLLEATNRDCLSTASLIAALITERPITISHKSGRAAFSQKFDNTLSPKIEYSEFNKPGVSEREDTELESDIFSLINALYFARNRNYDRHICGDSGIHGSACRHVWRIRDYFADICERSLGTAITGVACADEVLQCILAGFPDHLVRRRDRGSLVCELTGNRRAELERHSSIRDCNLMVAIDIREVQKAKEGTKIVLSLASEVRVNWLIDSYEDKWRFESQTLWNPKKRVVEKISSDYCLDLLINRRVTSEVDVDICGNILAVAISKEKLPLKGWTEDVKNWINRVQWISDFNPEYDLPRYDDADIKSVLSVICGGQRRYEDVKNVPCLSTVKNLVSPDNQKIVETIAPPMVALPSGRRMKIKYRVGKQPRANARIQDLFGLTDTPSVANGQQKLLIEILAPNMRAVQVTDDIAGFWTNLYPQVKKDLARRYPKHEWK